MEFRVELRDPVSSLTHLLTALWAAYATLVLIRMTPASPGRRLAVAVYGLSMVMLFAASALFHATPAAWPVFQRIDQSAIYVLIAGTNTPILVCLLGWSGRWLLGLLWGLAGIGIVAQWTFSAPPHFVIVAICLTLGWLGFLPVVHYYRALGWKPMIWIWAAGLSYSLGGIIEFVNWPLITYWPVRIGSHEVFHVLVVLGSLLFFAFITRHVVRHRAPISPASA
jgi:hemolysin III